MDFFDFANRVRSLLNECDARVSVMIEADPRLEHDCTIISYKGKKAYAAVLTDGLENQLTGRNLTVQIGKMLCDYITI
ncbi:hypothetical protein CVD25_08470 [Bacillus canaveralius]|uniref:Uncharacterized protein n=1 Tax=Bacillus canaveralius TaxID=1403243 RepID=A0A2N5GIG1_9BACI|nr:MULTISPECIES: hypothetical protein [Bacillus]PLR80731.1 hypothetical protein CU635_16900 [Bacillus canaveralius]PLR81721.1 hypothetical protein CVD23_18270 [Bacillus sp. V33-4]PLR98391.1 hypothetical protein CVD25_08470 [Bacillus canaveralius]RSK43049.1 hypothetical protein EJA13_21480 [Bacillus canaveralius]